MVVLAETASCLQLQASLYLHKLRHSLMVRSVVGRALFCQPLCTSMFFVCHAAPDVQIANICKVSRHTSRTNGTTIKQPTSVLKIIGYVCKSPLCVVKSPCFGLHDDCPRDNTVGKATKYLLALCRCLIGTPGELKATDLIRPERFEIFRRMSSGGA